MRYELKLSKYIVFELFFTINFTIRTNTSIDSFFTLKIKIFKQKTTHLYRK